MAGLVRVEGGLLPGVVLEELGGLGLPGMAPEDYGLVGERVRDAVARSWVRVGRAWERFVVERERLPAGDVGTTLVRQRWVGPLLEELGFGRLVPLRGGVVVGGESYPLSYVWQGRVPIHVVGCGVDLDRRVRGVAGAARWSPHRMVQELLNRSEEWLWGVVSNGLVLRLLRDNASMTRPAYVEFDLQGIMEGEAYVEFTLLWLLCHASRFEGDPPGRCWLERWLQDAQQRGVRALDRMRDGVQVAIERLGSGLVSHPHNRELRRRLEGGELSVVDLYRQLLRVVYRLLFLLVCEERGLLHPPDADAGAVARYSRFYSVGRLRRLAGQLRGSRHHDLWAGLQVVMWQLDGEGCAALGLPALGGGLWDAAATVDVVGVPGRPTRLRNTDLLGVVRALCWTTDDGGRRVPVDYRNLGADELGSVYEALLELHPRVDLGGGRFWLEVGAGHERKSTGSYYTPEVLIEELLRRGLDPLLDEAEQADDPIGALLGITVCDPACGSGHFLVAAAHRIAGRLAPYYENQDAEAGALAEGQADPYRRALRDVVGRCVFGVDVNPMAAELAKVNLWLEAQVPGAPLTFLDHHIVVGDALIGATPALVAAGIPDAAFEALEGDDRKVVAAAKRHNQRLRDGQLPLAAEQAGQYDALARQAAALERIDDRDLGGLQRKREAFERLQAEAERQRLLCDAWCAAFFVPKRDDRQVIAVIDTFYALRDGATPPPDGVRVVRELVQRHRFLHWHLAFPHILQPTPPTDTDHLGWRGGFTLPTGNPPWEMVELHEEEFFAVRAPEIAASRTGHQRKRRIAALAREDPGLYEAYVAAKYHAAATSNFLRNSGRFPLAGAGRVNTYQVFAELFCDLTAPEGAAAFLAPTGLVVDHTMRHFVAELLRSRRLAVVLDFENRQGIFPAVDSRYRFSVVVVGGPARSTDRPLLAAYLQDVADLHDPDRTYTLTAEDIRRINPNSGTLPSFRTRRDAEVTATIHRAATVLRRNEPPEDPWQVTLRVMFNMTTHSHLFHAAEQLEADGWRRVGSVYLRGRRRMLPLYEGKMVHQFDHRWAGYQGPRTAELDDTAHADPACEPLPRHWVDAEEITRWWDAQGWDRPWALGWRDITNATNERTLIVSVVPPTACGHNLPLLMPAVRPAALLLAVLDSLAVDFAARQKVGGTHVTFWHLEQLPVPPAETARRACPWDPSTTVGDWVVPRVVELVHASWLTSGFAAAHGSAGPPFRWDPGRRAQLRAELDAAIVHLYGLDRDAVEHILDSFPVLRRNEEGRYGEYRTRRLVLAAYDAMADAIGSGRPYRSPLDPPPAHPSLRHDSPPPEWFAEAWPEIAATLPGDRR